MLAPTLSDAETEQQIQVNAGGQDSPFTILYAAKIGVFLIVVTRLV